MTQHTAGISFYNKVSDGTGWKAGLACPCIYCKPGTFNIGWRHGDDIIIVGEEADITADHEYLSKHMILNKRAMSRWDDNDDKQINVLNRLITLSRESGNRTIEFEPDPRHAELIVREYGLEGFRRKCVSTPGEK